MAEKKRLTFFEAASTVAGYGIGSGIMAVPYLASFSGFIPFLGLLIVGYFISVLLHLMIVEMMLRDEESSQIIKILRKYLFRGSGGIFFTWLFSLKETTVPSTGSFSKPPRTNFRISYPTTRNGQTSYA